MSPNADRLRTLLLMTQAEVRSRMNAWDEVKEAGAAVLAEVAAHRTSSPELSSLAGEVLQMSDDDIASLSSACAQVKYEELSAKAKRLAGSVLAQDEAPGQQLDLGAPDPNDLINRTLVDAQNNGQARPLVQTLVRPEPRTSDMADLSDAELKSRNP